MKKFLVLVFCILCLCGCKKKDANDVIKTFTKKVNNADSYSLTANMSIIGDEEKFNYQVDVSYLKDEYYKVSLYNKDNNHEQIIIKNDDGVYVITPELNRSYKFESSWPNNSSQAYLLNPLMRDINSDDTLKAFNEGKYNVLKVKVNYPNNSDLLYEKIYFDNNSMVKKVEVYDTNNIEKIKVTFNNIKYNVNYNKEDFEIDEYINNDNINNENKENCEGTNCDKKTGNILEDIIYPLYLPSNTYLTSSDKIGEEGNQRVILTFSGDKNFTIVEESLYVPDKFEVSPVFGEPILLNDTIGVIDTNSIKWSKGNIDYYITSDNLTKSELVTLASSMNLAKSVIGSK